jgi:hypothetical protein
VRFRDAHAGGHGAAYDDRAMHTALGLSVATVADSGGPAADALLRDLLDDAIALVRGEERPVRSRVPAQRPATTWARAAGRGVRAG